MQARVLAFSLLLLPVATLAAELSTSQRLDLLERRVGRVTDLTMQLDAVRRENSALRGKIENLGYEIEQLKRKQRDIYLDVDQRLSSMQGGVKQTMPSAAANDPAPSSAAPVTDNSRVPTSSGDRSEIQAEYQAAYALLSPQQKRYDESAKAFAAFLQKYPQDALAPNAQYWLGEAYYVSANNKAALAAFEGVVSQYPGSTKAPGALFKIGRLHQAAGDAESARAAYQRVLKDYPNSPAVGLARQRLKQLGS